MRERQRPRALCRPRHLVDEGGAVDLQGMEFVGSAGDAELLLLLLLLPSVDEFEKKDDDSFSIPVASTPPSSMMDEFVDSDIVPAATTASVLMPMLGLIGKLLILSFEYCADFR